jgi:hypothetical protein
MGTHFIFFGEQFLGEGCPGALDSKEFRALVILGDINPSISILSRI